MSKHTPGPWVADDAFMLDGHAVRVGTPFKAGRLYESVTICECWVRDKSDPSDCEEPGDSPDEVTAEANARLIARAPTMASLLERIYTECDERDGGGDARFSGELYEELRRFVKEMQK